VNNIKVNTIAEKSYTKWQDYAMLVKLRLSLLVVFTSVIGYLIASNGAFSWTHLIMLSVAGLLTSGAANALNQTLEKDYDIHMARTQDRPVAAGRMKPSEAIMFAGLSCLVGISILALFNPLTAFLGMLSLITYAFVYTPLKRYGTIAVAVGAIPGALPILIGFTSFSGSITFLALGLFAIQYLWQFPHFWSIGYLAFEDYKTAGYKLLPSENGEIDKNIGLHAAIYAILIIPVAITLYIVEGGSIIPLMVTIILTITYTFLSLKMYTDQNRKSALYVMFGSFFYLPIVILAYLVFL
jgi:protoheme IX farnesyltransferase